jgi:hypothetical protein
MKNVLYILRGWPYFGDGYQFWVLDWAKLKNGSWMLVKMVGPNQRRKLLMDKNP